MENIPPIDNSPGIGTGEWEEARGAEGEGETCTERSRGMGRLVPSAAEVWGENFTPPPHHPGDERSRSSNTQGMSEVAAPTPKIQLLIYLIPVIGFFPSLWTLYRRQGSREQLRVSRLSITLGFTWLLAYLLLISGTGTSELFTLRLLILNSFFTSGYFIVSVWLMLRLIQGKSKRLPGFSSFAEKILGKFLA